MYIMITTLEEVKAGDTVVLRYDDKFNQIGAFEIGGGVLGYAAYNQPEGCLNVWTLSKRLGNRRILCTVAVALGGSVILYSDSPALKGEDMYRRIERGGYGMLTFNAPNSGGRDEIA